MQAKCYSSADRGTTGKLVERGGYTMLRHFGGNGQVHPRLHPIGKEAKTLAKPAGAG